MIAIIANVVSIVLVVIALATIVLNALLGFFGKNSRALAKLSILLISTTASLLFTKLIVYVTAGNLLPVIKNFAGKYLPDNIDTILSSFDTVVTAFAIMLVSPIIFLVVFFIVRLVLSLSLKKLFTKLYGKITPFFEKKRN